MKYIALKPCCFAGESFLIGSIIPDGHVANSKAQLLVSRGLIAPYTEPDQPDPAGQLEEKRNRKRPAKKETLSAGDS